MNLEQQINALLAQAAPLRSSTDAYDDEALGDIINQINALRAKQAKEPAWPVLNEVVEGADVVIDKRPPGRPKKHS